MWLLYLSDTGTETADFVISLLDLCYPKLDREKMDVFGKMDKYREARVGYDEFLGVIKGMVGNG
jgi:hypothetical protein